MKVIVEPAKFNAQVLFHFTGNSHANPDKSPHTGQHGSFPRCVHAEGWAWFTGQEIRIWGTWICCCLQSVPGKWQTATSGRSDCGNKQYLSLRRMVCVRKQLLSLLALVVFRTELDMQRTKPVTLTCPSAHSQHSSHVQLIFRVRYPSVACPKLCSFNRCSCGQNSRKKSPIVLSKELCTGVSTTSCSSCTSLLTQNAWKLLSVFISAVVDRSGDLCYDNRSSDPRLWAYRNHKQLPYKYGVGSAFHSHENSRHQR